MNLTLPDTSSQCNGPTSRSMMSSSVLYHASELTFFFLKIALLIFGCAESSLLCELLFSCGETGRVGGVVLWLPSNAFSLQWFL